MGFGSCFLYRSFYVEDDLDLHHSGLFEDPTRKVCLNSFLIALLNPIQTIFLIFFNLAVIYISLSSPERLLTAIYLFTFGGFALWSFLNVCLTDQIFQRSEGVFEK